MLDAREFAEALRQGVIRSGLTEGRGAADARYLSLAGTIVEYLKKNLEVTVPAGVLPAAAQSESPAVRCRVS
jgi:hypothetical protein